MRNTQSDPRLFAPATQRNREAILEVLTCHLPTSCDVLEVASGTGEHACFFAHHRPAWRWHPSDMSPHLLDSIRGWRTHTPCANLHDPVLLDVQTHPWPIESVDAVVAINLLHISGTRTTSSLMRGARSALRPKGKLVVYGPFSRQGTPTAPGNLAFDASLREQDPSWGVRAWEWVDEAAREASFVHCETVCMPANNLCSIWQRGGVRKT